MVVKVRLFGALKRFAKEGEVVLDIPEGCMVSQARERIKTALASDFRGEFPSALVDRAALSDSKRVLSNDELLGSTPELALLPPVCGG